MRRGGATAPAAPASAGATRRGGLGKAVQRIVVALLLALGIVCYAPQLLAFPYEARFGETVVRSERPIPAGFAAMLAQADALVAKSAIYTGPVPCSIFLTTGGWRWHVLALQTSGAFAFRRPFRNLIVVNDTDAADDRVANGRAVGGTRTLHDTLAHETTHILITDHFGTVKSLGFPTWKVEGYADYVAGASSLDDATAAWVRANQPDHPALPYYDGHRRVAALLADDPSVDHLFLS